MSDRADRMIQTLNATTVKGGPFIPDVKLEALLRVVAGEIDALEEPAAKEHGSGSDKLHGAHGKAKNK